MITDSERRPTAILLVYTWDIVRAILVFFVALAAFGGATDLSGKTVQLSTPVQILLALSSAALGAVLLLVGMLLTRHAAWVRRAQITVLGESPLVDTTSAPMYIGTVPGS